MSKRSVVIAAAILLYGSTICFGEEYPTHGIVYGTSETSSLTYACKLSGVNLECSFVQMSVRRKASPDDLKSRLQTAKSDFVSFKNDAAKQCQGVEALYEALSTGKLPPGADAKRFSTMGPAEKADFTKIVSAWRELCRAPTEVRFVEFIRVTHDRDSRTCSVSPNQFTQSFRRINIDGPWVVRDSPSGACGTVNVSRFEKEVGQSGLSFWKYFSKKVITNPKGNLLPGFGCSDLDEREYLYDWRSRESFLQCDYIKFSPI